MTFSKLYTSCALPVNTPGKSLAFVFIFIAMMLINTSLTASNKNDFIDIGLFYTECARFEVRMKPGIDVESGISNIQFALQWPAESVQLIDFESDLDVELQYEEQHEGKNYAVFVAVPDDNYPLNWKAGEEYVIMRFAHDESGEGVSDFLVADDTWTVDNNAEFFVELWGADLTGSMYHQALDSYVGECPFLIDAGLYNTECAHFEVRLRPDLDIPKGISNIQFTVKWPAETVGIDAFESSYDVELQFITEHQGFNYAVFVSVPDDDYPLDWQAGEEFVVLTFKHDESGTGTTTFSITDDAWANDNNGQFYVELWGNDFTGDVYRQAESTYIGACRSLDIRVFLEGPYDSETGEMHTSLANKGLIPKHQPFNVAPWSYNGDEYAVSFDEEVVDWVLVEFRDAPTVEAAIETNTFHSEALLLNKDGYLVNHHMQKPSLNTDKTIVNELFVIIRHRNHIDILSKAPMHFDPGSKAYCRDFSIAIETVFGEASSYKIIDTARNLHAMIAGDADGDGQILPTDRSIFRQNFGLSNVYHPADYDFDGEVLPADRSLFRKNFGVSVQF